MTMKMPSRRAGLFGFMHQLPKSLLALVLLLVPLWAQAQGMAALPAADQEAIHNYNLNDDVFNRLIAATKEARKEGIKPQEQPADPSKVHTLDDLAQQAVGGDPRISPLIKRYGFTPREFLLANIALMNAAMVEQSKAQPELASQIDQTKVNQANVTFIEAHQAQIQALMQSGAPQQ
jgi:hypothetical protein